MFPPETVSDSNKALKIMHAAHSWVAPHAVAVLWAVVNELLIQPREYTAFNLALQKLRDDPRIMVMIGTPVSGYGQETHNRAARQRIPHKVYTDDGGREQCAGEASETGMLESYICLLGMSAMQGSIPSQKKHVPIKGCNASECRQCSLGLSTAAGANAGVAGMCRCSSLRGAPAGRGG